MENAYLRQSRLISVPDMAVSVFFVALLVVLFTFLYKRRSNFKRKLWWVKAAPAFPLLGNALDFADSTKTLKAMQDYAFKYNGLCYIELLSRPIILISDYKFVEWQLSSNKLLTKSQDYQYLNKWLERGILISDGSEWRKSRKILTPAFHFAILERFVDIFEEPTSVLIDVLQKEIGKDEVDITPYITKYTLDIICQTSMGIQLKAQEGFHTEYVDAVAGMCNICIERAFNPLKMFNVCYRLSRDYHREKKYIKLLHEMSNRVIEKRRNEIENHTDQEDDGVETKRKLAFLDLLLKYRDENGQPLPQNFIRQEVDTFMFAGHDTTASALSFALFCLANHPEVQANAFTEIKEVLENRETIAYKDLQEMKYLELVVKEALRLFPPVPMYSRTTTEDIIYDGDKIIPKGVTLIILAYAINRDPNVYDEPNKFIPTRFLNMENKPFSYVPFSAGPRNCIGQKFAMLEIKYALAKILLNFELIPANPEYNPILVNEVVLKSKNGVKFGLKERR